MLAVQNKSTITVEIPKNQVLDVRAIGDLMQRVDSGEDL
ncbi:DUF4365 domain-containing protein [bacterium]|nr:DUF4365 domain-containing protein [bacterium]